jgi:hypothetical protein
VKPPHLSTRRFKPSTGTTESPSFDSARSWAFWCLRELHRLGLRHAIAPQARALVAIGYLTEDDTAPLLDELLGRQRSYQPPPIPRQLDLLSENQ